MWKFIFTTLVVLLFVSGIIIYTEWDKRKFLESLPEPPTNVTVPEVEQPRRVDALPSSVHQPVVEQVEAEGETIPDEHVSDDYDWRTDNDAHHVHNPDPDSWVHKDTAKDEPPLPESEEMLQSLIERFGDIPQVHTHVEFHRIRSERNLTLDEEIVHLEAMLFLFPNEATRKTLVLAKWEKANGFILPTQADVEYFKSEGITVLYNEDGSLNKITTKY